MKTDDLKTAAERMIFAQGILAGLQSGWKLVLGHATDLNAAGHVGNAQAVVGAANLIRDRREALLGAGGDPPDDGAGAQELEAVAGRLA